MKFITRKELNYALSDCSLGEISSYKDRIIDHAEDVAIDVVKGYIASVYDMDYELRSFKDYEYSTIYNDNDRIRITNNKDNHDFATFYNIELIDKNYYKQASTSGVVDDCDCFYDSFVPTEDGDDELILVKIPNECPSEYLKKPVKTYYHGNKSDENYYNSKNPDYDESCGIIVGTNGIYNNGEIINYYNSQYGTDGSITPIDYSIINILDIPNYQTVEYFDQYLLENQDRDFRKDDRNHLLIQLVVDITIYTLVQRVSPRMISEMIKERYEDAIETLKKIYKGEFQINLSRFPESDAFQSHMSSSYGFSKQGGRNSY